MAAVESFVLGQLRAYALNAEAIRKAVHDANAGRDDALAKVQEELQQKKAAFLQASKVVARLLDTLEQGADDAALESLRARLRDREAAKNQLKVEVGDLEAKRQALRQQMLDAVAVVEGYAKLPFVIDEAERLGARQELKHMLQTVIESIEWRRDAKDPKRGEALIKLYELPAEFGLKALNEEQPDELSVNSSSGCVKWLPIWNLYTHHGPLCGQRENSATG